MSKCKKGFIIVDSFINVSIFIRNVAYSLRLYKVIKNKYLTKYNNEKVAKNLDFKAIGKFHKTYKVFPHYLIPYILKSFEEVEDYLDEDAFIDYCDAAFTCVTYLNEIKTKLENDTKNSKTK